MPCSTASVSRARCWSGRPSGGTSPNRWRSRTQSGRGSRARRGTAGSARAAAVRGRRRRAHRAGRSGACGRLVTAGWSRGPVPRPGRRHLDRHRGCRNGQPGTPRGDHTGWRDPNLGWTNPDVLTILRELVAHGDWTEGVVAWDFSRPSGSGGVTSPGGSMARTPRPSPYSSLAERPPWCRCPALRTRCRRLPSAALQRPDRRSRGVRRPPSCRPQR